MIPVSINEKYEILIDGTSFDGRGVGHINGFAVFVPETCPGDTASVRITSVRKSFAVGECVEIIKAAGDRVEPKCTVTKSCGGCQLQHIAYPAQLEGKRLTVESAMARIGGFKDFKLDEVIGADEPFRYRNKVIFHFKANGNDTPIFGFYPAKSIHVTPVSDCLLCDEIFSRIARAVAEYSKDFDLVIGGTFRNVFIRRSSSTGETVVIASVQVMRLKNPQAFVEYIRGASDDVSGIVVEYPLADGGYKLKTLYGSDTITDSLLGLNFVISPRSFFQINRSQTEKLYRCALDFANISDSDTVLDIYCGIGTITLCAARLAKKAVGVEIVSDAIKNAEQNVVLNGIKNAEFFVGAASEIVPQLIERGDHPSVVILDPPRAGSDEKTLAAIVSAQPERVVYVSCDPATLARDTKFLAENGYAVKRSAVVDMFPNTRHVETVVLMSRKGT